MNLKPNTKIKLDHLGQYYATVNSQTNPGTFGVTAYLKETIIPNTLQQAVNNFMQRLPFMNVRSKRGIMWHYHEVLSNPPKIVSEKDFPALCSPFNNGNDHLIRFIYGERSITIEVLHTVCDGRSLAMVLSSLLARYFELLGEEINKEELIDCKEDMQMEEMEDAYVRYADLRKTNFTKGIKDIYIPKYKPNATRIITERFNLSQIKAKAKLHGLTITEYILANIGSEFEKQRMNDKSSNGITVNIPIDCRGFFPSKSLRNFVSSKPIKIPQTMVFNEIGKVIKKQFAEITPNYIQSKISEVERAMRMGKFFPLFIKSVIIKKIGEAESTGYTTGFSNLGMIKLPKEIYDKIDTFSFALGAEPNMPYQFACVALGDTLSVSTTTTARDTEIIERIMDAL